MLSTNLALCLLIFQDGFCHSDKVKPVAVVSSYVNITSGDQDALRAAIANKGPISVAIDAAHKSLSFYANGVYYEPQCGEYFSGKNLEKYVY